MWTAVELWKNWLTGFTDWRSTCCPLFFVVVQNETTLWISKIFNFLIVWRLFCFLSLSVSLFSLFFPSSIWFPSLLTWIEITPPDCNNFPPRWTPPVIGLNKQTNKNLFLSPEPCLLTNHTALNHHKWFCPCVSVCLCVCVSPFSPLHPHYPPTPLYLLFLLCGKQMKNLGRKAASACSLKRTISARGKCCNNCAAEHAHKRGDGT